MRWHFVRSQYTHTHIECQQLCATYRTQSLYSWCTVHTTKSTGLNCSILWLSAVCPIVDINMKINTFVVHHNILQLDTAVFDAFFSSSFYYIQFPNQLGTTHDTTKTGSFARIKIRSEAIKCKRKSCGKNIYENSVCSQTTR